MMGVVKMPTVLRSGPYRFFFYSRDISEPAHVHVEREDKVAKIWIDPVVVERDGRFRSAELNDIVRLVLEYRQELLAAWQKHVAESQ